MFYFSPLFSYIKKEDVKDFIKKQRITFSVMLFACFGITVIMNLLVGPKILGLYKDLNQQLPIITQYSNYIMYMLAGLLLIASIYYYFTSPNYQRLDSLLKKYKSGEMIRSKEILEGKYEYIILLALGIVTGLMVLVYIIPIYSITESVK